MLHPVDWAIIAAYLLLALGVGLAMRGGSSTGRRSYFLADRSLPWWWAGVSIAATTFAADTPLAVAGIIASRGISGKWLWLSWILVHAGVVAVFARRWWRSDVVTDAEFISRRYDDAATGTLRTFRAGLYGLVYNVIILGWVLRAMGKIAHPLVPWEEWAPGLTHAAARFVPEGSALGGPGEFLTILVLVLIVTLYSSLGGIRGVVRTDLVQFGLGMSEASGSPWPPGERWVGGPRSTPNSRRCTARSPPISSGSSPPWTAAGPARSGSVRSPSGRTSWYRDLPTFRRMAGGISSSASAPPAAKPTRCVPPGSSSLCNIW